MPSARNCLLIIFFSLCTLPLVAQDSAAYVRRYTSVWRAVNVGYEINYLNKKAFQNFYKDSYQESFGSQLNSIVLELGGPENYLEDIYTRVSYYMPVNFNSGDTTKATLQGFSFDTQFIKGLNLLFTQKEIDLPVYGFWQIGSIYLNQNGEKSHNFFLNFGARAAFRVLLFKRLTLGISADISWDVTKDHWKYKREVVPEIPGFKKTSYGVQVSLGWRYSKRQASWVRIYN